MRNAAALRFQPTKRPGAAASAQKPGLKTAQAKAAALTAALAAQKPTDSSQDAATKATPPAPAQPKTTLADWTGDGDPDDVNGFYGERRRGGRKKRKKGNNRKDPSEAAPQNWDDMYDPTRPNVYDAYRHSDERIREVRDWKARLYAHRARPAASDSEDSEDGPRARMSGTWRERVWVGGIGLPW